ncbi:MAG: alanyl-tRNA editing protein [Sphaerochaetaceae bacterium]|jgi:alanyl-tRNA synthetase|nr:alanyl-tRNA editing protein [Sphaerochaetaceae bacterium]MDY0371340.1 alanyl-tRNA editing protein [Sphaerochaetaceae bacterium]
MYSTIPLYYSNSYDKKLRAFVLALSTYAGKPAVILDRTLFYPEGGGQVGDIGTLNDEAVIDTQKDDHGTIFHVLAAEPTFAVGDTVTLQLDWSHRYDYMQQHTAQHLLSGTMHRLFGIGTVSVHFGHADMSIEIDAQELSDTNIVQLEDTVNAIIRQAIPVTSKIVGQEEAQALGLRRSIKVNGDVRIIAIKECDTIACGGIHVSNTSELHYIQYLRSERIRGHLRTFWVAGSRAIATIRKNQTIVDTVGTLLSTPAENIIENVSTLQQQLGEAQYLGRLHAVQVAKLLLEKELQQAKKVQNIPLVVVDASSWSEPYIKNLPEALLELSPLALCVVSEREDEKLNWLICLKGIEHEGAIFQAIRKQALPLIKGKGGGKPPLWQGIGADKTSKVQFIKQVKAIFLEWING